MNGVVQFDPIHHLVVRIMGELGEAVTDETQITKSVLVREGHYCGRAFKCGDIRAVWFADANELKFYRDAAPCCEPCAGWRDLRAASGRVGTRVTDHDRAATLRTASSRATSAAARWPDWIAPSR